MDGAEGRCDNDLISVPTHCHPRECEDPRRPITAVSPLMTERMVCRHTVNRGVTQNYWGPRLSRRAQQLGMALVPVEPVAKVA